MVAENSNQLTRRWPVSHPVLSRPLLKGAVPLCSLRGYSGSSPKQLEHFSHQLGACSLEVIPNCRATSSKGKPDASPDAGRGLWRHSDKASRERMWLHQRKSLCIPPAPVLSNAWQSGMGWLQDKMQTTYGLTRSHHTAGFIPDASCPLEPAMLQSRRHRFPGDLDAWLQERPSGPLPQPRPCFIVFASSCSESGAPLALCGTNPGVARPRPAPASAGMRHRPHPAPSEVQQGPLLQPSRDSSAGHSTWMG